MYFNKAIECVSINTNGNFKRLENFNLALDNG